MISRLTIWTIQSNPVILETYKDKNTKLFGFLISHSEGKHYRPLVTSQPTFENEQKAKKTGQETLNFILNWKED